MKDVTKVIRLTKGNDINGYAIVQKMPLLKKIPITRIWTR